MDDWLRARECRDKDTRIFFPLPKERGTVTLAKAICSRCPVRGACLHLALRNHEEFGIWGGTTEDERRKISAILGSDINSALTQISETG